MSKSITHLAICVIISMMSSLIPSEDVSGRMMMNLLPLMINIVLNLTVLSSVPRAPYTALQAWIGVNLLFSLLPLIEYDHITFNIVQLINPRFMIGDKKKEKIATAKKMIFCISLSIYLCFLVFYSIFTTFL